MTHALGAGSIAIDAGTCTDPAGNTVATDQRGYTRVAPCDIGAFEYGAAEPGPAWPFSGFLSPVSSQGYNQVKAGQAVPIRFRLGGDRGLDIFASGSPTSRQFQCNLSEGTSDALQSVTAGTSRLSYDADTNTYTYIWKTEKGWANSCRSLTLVFTDEAASSYSVDFRFTR